MPGSLRTQLVVRRRRCWPQAGFLWSAVSPRWRPRGGRGLRRWRVAGWRVRAAGLDLVAVAAAVFPLDGVAGRGQVADDVVGAALGDAHAGRDVAQPRARVMGDAQQ